MGCQYNRKFQHPFRSCWSCTRGTERILNFSVIPVKSQLYVVNKQERIKPEDEEEDAEKLHNIFFLITNLFGNTILYNPKPNNLARPILLYPLKSVLMTNEKGSARSGSTFHLSHPLLFRFAINHLGATLYP